MSSINGVNPNSNTNVDRTIGQQPTPNNTTPATPTTPVSGVLPAGQISVLTGAGGLHFGGLAGTVGPVSGLSSPSTQDGAVLSAGAGRLTTLAGTKNVTPTVTLVGIASSRFGSQGSVVNGLATLGSINETGSGPGVTNNTNGLASVFHEIVASASGGFGYKEPETSQHVATSGPTATAVGTASTPLLENLLVSNGDSILAKGEKGNSQINGDKQATRLDSFTSDKLVKNSKDKGIERDTSTSTKSDIVQNGAEKRGVLGESSSIRSTHEVIIDGSRIQGVVVDPKTKEKLTQDNKGPHSFFVARDQRDGNSQQQQNQDQEDSENRETAPEASLNTPEYTSPIEAFNQKLRGMSPEQRERFIKEIEAAKSKIDVLKNRFDEQVKNGASASELNEIADSIRDTVSGFGGSLTSFGAFESVFGIFDKDEVDTSTVLGGYYGGGISTPQIPVVPKAPKLPDENASEADRLRYTAQLANYQFAINSIQTAILDFYRMLDGLLTSTNDVIKSMNSNLARA